ncbi:acyl-CoA dehydrogenase [Leptospira perolatii]|uniref:Acyl-CoA dehydrogenase n=1 Tax=Leptospira perolatii TaxID=2023191 RepID=A0A2M9ZSX0_9LEPT|nr:acyl-CoA dehydrogenase family protein [Leptospira perolatii]PJZ71527.1 acyl-CoA dehydrogenase [Leptospira perolatii]PJZ75059.1 acyl-CoA dehydrogenase [Leptospira perolatii]
MIQNNYFNDVPDLKLHFDHLIHWKEIIDSYENGFSDAAKFKAGDDRYATAPSNYEEALDYYRTLVESVGEFAGKEIAPHVADLDREGLKFENGKVIFPEKLLEIVRKARDAGLQPTGFSRKYGGLGIPWTVRAFITEMLYRADASICIAIGCVNLAEIIERNGSDELKDAWLPRFAAGEFACAMGLTEPDHGSDLPGLRTRATHKEGNTYLLNGTKRFITQGCGTGEIPAVLLLLARTGDQGSGARGLSFFLVQSKDVQIAGIEKKMGLHCSPTCEVVLENTPGILIGQEGHGLIRHTMGMLNGARMGIAQQGTGISQAALAETLKYTSERTQFSRPLNEIPAVRKILRRMERETMAMRCLMLEGARTMDMYYWRGEHLRAKGANDRDLKSDIVLKYWEKLAGLLTPISKFYCSEMCVRIAGDGVQLHGGVGFTEDYDISRIYRDSRITTIYDGTSQIQVNAAIGSVVSGMSSHGFLKEYVENEWKKFETQDLGVLPEVWDCYKEIISLYKELPSSESREESADEIIWASARLLAGLLFFRSTLRTPNELKRERLNYVHEYNLDSFGILEGLKAKLKLCVAESKPVLL